MDPTADLFKGFERSQKFEGLFHRLEILEKWKELAIRPSKEEIDEEDVTLLATELDDIPELERRCLSVRERMNAVIPPIEIALDDSLIPKPSQIPGAGLGLFYSPSQEPTAVLPKGSILCYYTGHLHNFHSSRTISDKSYLMMVKGDTLVDPGPLKHIKARYINDPLNENTVNCEFIPQELRSAVVATREIHPGEELFVAYGDAYWTQHPVTGRTLTTASTD